MSTHDPIADAFGALAEGRWADARIGFEQSLATAETAEACFGLAMALWWLGENHASGREVRPCLRTVPGS